MAEAEHGISPAVCAIYLFSFQKHISFLHGEFSRQISFPRKALDCDFALYAGGAKGEVRWTPYFLKHELSSVDLVSPGIKR